MSATLIRNAMDAVAPLNYDPSVNRLKAIMMKRGMTEQQFDAAMQTKVPTSEALNKMRDEGKFDAAPLVK